MERYQNRLYSSSLKEDSSLTELLPVKSAACSFTSPQLENGQDRTERKSSSDTRSIKGWPQTSKTLRKMDWKHKGLLVIDILIGLIPLSFIVLTIVAVRLSGSPISTGGETIRAATTLGPTVFPIVFATIVGRSLKSLALFQAERGARLGTLEQLTGSLTVSGTVELQIRLRTFGTLGTSLIVLWALSPLGGQASLRLLDYGNSPTTSPQNISYLNPEKASILAEGADAVQTLGFEVNALYLSALFTPPAGQASAVDTWSNVKIPTIEKLESTSKSDADGWYDVPVKNTSYSSLVGLPIDNSRISGLYHFYVESLYMTLDCPTVSDFTNENVSNGGFSLQFIGVDSTQSLLHPNQTSYPPVKPWGVNFSALSFIESDNAFTANCTLTRSSVESNVTCRHESCSVAQIRRSKFDQRPPGYTPLYSGAGVANLQYYWPISGGSEHEGSSTPTEYFLADPTLRSLSTSRNSWGVSLKGLSAALFSERFSLLLNTYWQCSLVPWYQTGDFPSNTSSLNDDLDGDGVQPFNTTMTTVTTYADIYVCNKVWAAILFIASIALFLCGVCGTIAKYMARGPDILGYVSSLTRDNPYIDLPLGGCTLDGLERARLLKNLKAKLQDVTGEDEIGHIALSSAETLPTTNLVPGRLYA